MSDQQIPPPPPPDIPDPVPPPPPPPPPAPPSSGGGSGAVSENRTIFLVLSYLGVLALIPFFMEKDDQEVRWHAKHGLVLLGTWIVLTIGVGMLGAILTMVIDVFGCFGCFGGSFVGLAYMVVSIVCIVKALNGERFKIPVVSDFVEKF